MSLTTKDHNSHLKHDLVFSPSAYLDLRFVTGAVFVQALGKDLLLTLGAART
jgi:hypothetical protein